MNVFVKELKFGFKSFVIWTLALAFFAYAGTIKFTGAEAGNTQMVDLFNKFPRLILAVMGFARDIDVGTFSGFYALLDFYFMLIVAVYAVSLGRNAISREQVGKTTDFLFVKPRSRASVLTAKLAAGVTYLTVLCAANLLFSQSAYALLNLSENMLGTFVIFSVALWVVGLIFLALGALAATAFSRAETGSQVGNYSVIGFYLVAVAYNSFDSAGFLRPFSPFVYFDPARLAEAHLELGYLAFSVVLIAAALGGTYWLFGRRDFDSV